MKQVANRPIILYAEDDYDDFDSLKEALDQLSDHHLLMHAKNGADAVSFIKNSTVLPSLIVLDLNMPIMDGKEVLLWLKNRNQYKHIPIIVFTTSSREDDIKLCKEHNCTFVLKPTSYNDLSHIAQIMLKFCEQ